MFQSRVVAVSPQVLSTGAMRNRQICCEGPGIPVALQHDCVAKQHADQHVLLGAWRVPGLRYPWVESNIMNESARMHYVRGSKEGDLQIPSWSGPPASAAEFVELNCLGMAPDVGYTRITATVFKASHVCYPRNNLALLGK